MQIKVLFFASVRELFGVSSLEVEVPEGAKIFDLDLKLREMQKGLAEIPFVYAKNRAYATAEEGLRDGDEVALVPAISGGEPPAFAFTMEEINPRVLEEYARSDADGALVTFVGVTRNHHEGKNVATLSYEAYEDMVLPLMERLLFETRQKLEVGQVFVRHRLGEVRIGEASIVVVVAAPHRGPAFEAAREIMDRIKKEIPIFKKETLLGDQGSHWVGQLPE
jgi:molybdopterin synthase catalytic subunit